MHVWQGPEVAEQVTNASSPRKGLENCKEAGRRGIATCKSFHSRHVAKGWDLLRSWTRGSRAQLCDFLIVHRKIVRLGMLAVRILSGPNTYRTDCRSKSVHCLVCLDSMVDSKAALGTCDLLASIARYKIADMACQAGYHPLLRVIPTVTEHILTKRHCKRLYQRDLRCPQYQ